MIGYCVGIVVLPAIMSLHGLSFTLFEKLHPQEQQVVEILVKSGWLAVTANISLGIGSILVAPLGEEILFRGILYPAIKRTGHKQIALWSTALLFGLIHANLASFVPLTLLAVVLVWLYEYTGNLLACFAVHSLFNAVNFVALYLQQK